eukprot:3137392-Rhodomonas_salina.1
MVWHGAYSALISQCAFSATHTQTHTHTHTHTHTDTDTPLAVNRHAGSQETRLQSPQAHALFLRTDPSASGDPRVAMPCKVQLVTRDWRHVRRWSSDLAAALRT